MRPTTERDYWTAKEYARILGCHWRTVHRMCQRGELVHKRAGRDYRIPKEDAAQD